MDTVTSIDGTKIAFDQTGLGPALILVSGAMMHRAMDPGSAELATFIRFLTIYLNMEPDSAGK